MLAFLLSKVKNAENGCVTAPLAEYAALRGWAVVNNKTVQRVKYQLAVIANTECTYRENKGSISNDGVPMGDYHTVTADQFIVFQFGVGFIRALKALGPMDIGVDILRTDPSGSAFHLGWFVDCNYRMNEGKKRANKIRIATLL